MTGLTDAGVPFLPRGVRLHHCEVREGWYLLAPERAVKMNDIGVAILNVLDGERSFEAVVDKLATDFKAPRDRIATDAGKFLTDLMNRRMVEVRE
ncbi:MAG: pyrroloquinoline quinone biosynthesis peptide chaperone PqqD [Paracoccaceae bacterium]